MKRNKNIFTFLLDELKIKHTKWFSGKYYNEHGGENNIYEISRMLSYYQIENPNFFW